MDGARAVGDSTSGLTLGPRWLYPAKAVVTRTRSTAWLCRPGRRVPPGLRILFYHRVADDRDELAVSPRAFAAQMDELARRGYRGVGVGEVLAALAGGGQGAKLVGLSFDDGYADIAEHALPALERHGFTATVFVSTGVTDGRARLTWYRDQPPLLDWQSIRELDGASALSFEAHTVTHPNLLELDDESARREIAESRAELAEQLGRPVQGFCYPAGLFGLRERDLVAQSGFDWATSCEPGANDAATDRFALRRIQVDARDGLIDFRSKLLGGHDRPLPLRGMYRRLRYRAPAAASSRS
jgi:peptidoglycan/xylan/chitin deacetylase (PgdA/CDA1 family)